jgi:hypothetical protein
LAQNVEEVDEQNIGEKQLKCTISSTHNKYRNSLAIFTDQQISVHQNAMAEILAQQSAEGGQRRRQNEQVEPTGQRERGVPEGFFDLFAKGVQHWHRNIYFERGDCRIYFGMIFRFLYT